MAHILVVDDALMMRKTIGTFLVKAGHSVEEAANGKQAVEAYKRQRPDLVTMDITMPELDGIEGLSRIMAFDSQARVVMVSALGQKHKVFDALQKGAKGYILKPFTEEKLLAIIDELLGATTGKSKEIPPDLTVMNSYEVKPLTAKMAFSIETREGKVRITVLREFAATDYEDMVKAIKNIRLGLPAEIVIDFTSGNGLSSKTVLPFKEIIEDAVVAGDALRIVCHTQDYASYFRSFSGVKEIEFDLIKKVSA